MLKETALNALSQITMALISLACAYLIFYINKAKKKIAVETEKLKDERQRQLIITALNDLDDIAGKTVKEIEQTTAGALRELVKDGKADRQELLDLGEKAYKDIVTTMNPEYMALLNSTIGNMDKYIKSLIESKVYELKSGS